MLSTPALQHKLDVASCYIQSSVVCLQYVCYLCVNIIRIISDKTDFIGMFCCILLRNRFTGYILLAHFAYKFVVTPLEAWY